MYEVSRKGLHPEEVLAGVCEQTAAWDTGHALN